MFKNSFSFFSKKETPLSGAGISISDSGIYGVVLKNTGKGIVVTKSSSVELYFKPALHHAINTSNEVIKSLRQVVGDLEISRAHIGIPIRHYYYRCIYVPKKPDNVSEESHFENKLSSWLEDNTHIPNTSMICEYDIVKQNKDGSAEVSVGLVPKRIVEHYRNVCLRAGVLPLTIGTPLKQLHEACLGEDVLNNNEEIGSFSSALIDIEPNHSHISVYSNKRPIWNHTIHHDIKSDPEKLAIVFEKIINDWDDAVYESFTRRSPIKKVFVHGTSPDAWQTAMVLNKMILPDTSVFADKIENVLSFEEVHQVEQDALDKFANAIMLAKEGLSLD